MVAIETYTRVRTAYHEAGHAIASVLAGRESTGAELNDDGGGVAHYFAPNPTTPEGRAAELIVVMAGPIAGALATGSADPWTKGTGKDRAQVRELLGLADHETIEGSLAAKVCENKARQLLENHWPAVAALARWLLKNGNASGGLVHAMTQESLKRLETASHASR